MKTFKFASKNSHGKSHATLLDALNWATGSHLHIFEDGVLVQSVGVSDILKTFARNCARQTLKSFSGSEFAPKISGLWSWLNNNPIQPETWQNLKEWAIENRLVWMDGGNAEAAMCNAILAHSDSQETHYYTWMAAEHAKRLLGHRELSRQRKSILQAINKLELV